MAFKVPNQPSSLRRFRNERFTEEQGWHLCDLAMNLSGNIAVSGYNESIAKTFIDLYNTYSGADLLYSREFEVESEWHWQYVALMNDSSKIITCISHKLKIIDVEKDEVSSCCTLDGRAQCLAFREEQIFIGIFRLHEVHVYGKNLLKIRSIFLEGIERNDWLKDIAVNRDRLLVCTILDTAVSYEQRDGKIVTKFKHFTEPSLCNACSIAASSVLDVTSILWLDSSHGTDRRQIVVYTGSNYNQLVAFDAPGVSRLKISDSGLLVAGVSHSGEVKMFELTSVLVNSPFHTPGTFTYRGFGQTSENDNQRDEEKKDLETHLNVIQFKLQETEKHLQDTNRKLKVSKEEHEQFLFKSVKEEMAMKEIINLLQERCNCKNKFLTGNTYTNDASVEKTSREEQLAAEYGRVMVGIAQNLTLDFALQLAQLFGLPPAGVDLIRRSSMDSIPGVRCLQLLREYGKISMYDTTNLQKALALLQLTRINDELLKPYHKIIRPEEYEQNKLQELFSWEEIQRKDNMRESNIDDAEDKHGKSLNVVNTRDQQIRKTEMVDIKKNAQDQHFMRQFSPHYTEQKIGKGGGNINAAGVRVRIPPEAILDDCIIALTVGHAHNDDFKDHYIRTGMTPVMKLEPLGLELRKPIQLSIPHSALIPERELLELTVFSGEETDTNTPFTGIRWTEKTSVKYQLNEKHVEIDLYSLSYISIHLVSSNATQLYVFRAVPFVDGIQNVDDDLHFTICFCNDNDAEYEALLSDYQLKLPLEAYTTFQVSRKKAIDIELCIPSMDNTYSIADGEFLKKVSVDYLCSASRVSKTFILKRNFNKESDQLDIMLNISQGEEKRASIPLRKKLIFLQVSHERLQALLTSLRPDEQQYTTLLSTISSRLTRSHCEGLAKQFNLTRSDMKAVINEDDDGKGLMSILEEKRLIMPERMIDLYTALNVIDLTNLARLVIDYIKNYSEQRFPLQHQDNGANVDTTTRPVSPSTYTALSAKVSILVEEGFKEHDVIKAMELSCGSLVLARQFLQCLKEHIAAKPTVVSCSPYKESYIDENGGTIIMSEADTELVVPSAAVKKGDILSLSVINDKDYVTSQKESTLRLSPIVRFNQGEDLLKKSAIVKIPHCGLVPNYKLEFDVFRVKTVKGMRSHRWKKVEKSKCKLNSRHVEVQVQGPCCLYLAFKDKADTTKMLRALPLVNRMDNAGGPLQITIWLYNDNEAEHKQLLREVALEGKHILHDYQIFNIKRVERGILIKARSENEEHEPFSDESQEEILKDRLWCQTKCKAEFSLHVKENTDVINLSLYGISLWKREEQFRFSISIQANSISKPAGLHAKEDTEPTNQPEMEASFTELIRFLSDRLDVKSSVEIAKYLRLSIDVTEDIRISERPGSMLLGVLIDDSLITKHDISSLVMALTETDNEGYAHHVKEFRKNNPTNKETTHKWLE